MFLKISQNSQENTCARVSFLIKLGFWHKYFLVNFTKFLRTLSLKNTPGRLLLYLLTIFLTYLFINDLKSKCKLTYSKPQRSKTYYLTNTYGTIFTRIWSRNQEIHVFMSVIRPTFDASYLAIQKSKSKAYL